METCPYRKASFSVFVAGRVVSVCHVIDGLSHINLSRALGMGFSRCVYMYLFIYSSIPHCDTAAAHNQAEKPEYNFACGWLANVKLFTLN